MKKDVVIIGAGPPLPESEDRPLHELQAILPHYYGLFRRGRVF